MINSHGCNGTLQVLYVIEVVHVLLQSPDALTEALQSPCRIHQYH